MNSLKLISALILIFGCTNYKNKNEKLQSFIHNSWPIKEPNFDTFVISSEMEIGLAWPIISQAPQGVYVSLGAERSFRGASMAPNTTMLLVIDISPKVARFTQINAILLRAKNRLTYRYLRWEASLEEWQKMFGTVLSKKDFEWWVENIRNSHLTGYGYPEMFNRFEKDITYERAASIYQNLLGLSEQLKQHHISGKYDANTLLSHTSWKKISSLAAKVTYRLTIDEESLEWWHKIIKSDDKTTIQKCWQDWVDDFSRATDLSSFVDYKTGNYLFDDVLYQRLHNLAQENLIHSIYLDLTQIDKINALAEALTKANLKISVLDLDNTWHKYYLPSNSYETAVRAFSDATYPDSILLGMGNYDDIACIQLQTYFGFRFSFVEQWPHDFSLSAYIAKMPKKWDTQVNGKLYDSKHLPPYWNTWKNLTN